MNQTLYTCLNALDDGQIKRLMRHVAKGTDIHCGNEYVGQFFVHKGVCDPVILACFEDGYSTDEATFHDLHPGVQAIYEKVAHMVADSGYVNALEESTRHDVRHVIVNIGRKRGFPIYKTGKLSGTK